MKSLFKKETVKVFNKSFFCNKWHLSGEAKRSSDNLTCYLEYVTDCENPTDIAENAKLVTILWIQH
jgi:hypothetical protein